MPRFKASATPGRPRLDKFVVKRAASESSSVASCEPPARRSKDEEKRQSTTTFPTIQPEMSPEIIALDENAIRAKVEKEYSEAKRAAVAKVMQTIAEVVPLFESVLSKLYDVHEQVLGAEDDHEILYQMHKNLVKTMKERLDTTYF
ncbi:hypothetical protein DPV78_012547 [Talaromyces pinophilus]|nr:hypothetical protein DPV78_012547 [Talaromyces pinophilus]